MSVDSLTQLRREKRAAEIAREVDPLAGDFFRRNLVRAALLGMAFEESKQDGAAESKQERS